jgi:hypothetical protein
MADIRIKDLATTAASTASDDFVAVDGSANGTRKLNAYSPTFGGNLTVSGNVSSAGNFATSAASSFPGSVGTNGLSYYFGSSAGGAVIYGKGSVSDVTLANSSGSDAITIPAGTTNAKVVGNLTVSGTGTSSVAGKLGIGNPSPGEKFEIYGTNQSARIFNTAAYNSSGSAYYGYAGYFNSSNADAWFARMVAGKLTTNDNNADGYWALQVNGHSDGIVERLRVVANGNLLLGTTTDNGAKFQVEGYATFNRNGADGYLSVSRTSGATGTFGAGSTNAYLGTATNHSLVLYTNSTTALTLDSSQRCILAGALRLNNAYTAGAPTATGYVTLQDSAGNTYKVLVGT